MSYHANDTSKASHRQPVDHADVDTPIATRTTMGQMKRLSMVQTITMLMMKTRMKILKSIALKMHVSGLIDAIGKFKEESRLPLNEGKLIQL